MGALYYENEGHLDPLRLVNAFSKAARRLGAEVWTGTLVTGLEARGGGVTAGATRQGGGESQQRHQAGVRGLQARCNVPGDSEPGARRERSDPSHGRHALSADLG